MRLLIISLTVAASLLQVAEAGAAEMIKYGDGLVGRIYKFDMPLSAEKQKDRYLKLSIRLAEEPKVFPSDLRAAQIAACNYNRAKMLKAAREINSADDWRVKVTFDWVVANSNGVEVTRGERATLKLVDCGWP
ncbi:MAG: hypothetical protein ACPGGK_14525 [Pikeienuella sp.]